MKSELKPCPFCGGPARVVELLFADEEAEVGCANDECKAFVMVTGSTQPEAVAAWNRRPFAPEPKAWVEIDEERGFSICWFGEDGGRNAHWMPRAKKCSPTDYDVTVFGLPVRERTLRVPGKTDGRA